MAINPPPKKIELDARKPVSPTVKWAEFQRNIAREAQRQAGERAKRDRERKASTDYHRAATDTTEEGSA